MPRTRVPLPTPARCPGRCGGASLRCAGVRRGILRPPGGAGGWLPLSRGSRIWWPRLVLCRAVAALTYVMTFGCAGGRDFGDAVVRECNGGLGDHFTPLTALMLAHESTLSRWERDMGSCQDRPSPSHCFA